MTLENLQAFPAAASSPDRDAAIGCTAQQMSGLRSAGWRIELHRCDCSVARVHQEPQVLSSLPAKEHQLRTMRSYTRPAQILLQKILQCVPGHAEFSPHLCVVDMHSVISASRCHKWCCACYALDRSLCACLWDENGDSQHLTCTGAFNTISARAR